MNKGLIIGGAAIAGLGVLIYLMKKKSDTTVQVAQAEAQKTTAQAQILAAEAQKAQKQEYDAMVKAASPILSKYPKGTLLRVGSSPSIYQIDDFGKARWIINRTVFNQMHLNMANVKSISQADFDKIPQGTPITTAQGMGNIVHMLAS